MFKFFKVFLVMLVILCCSIKSYAGYWTVTYSGGVNYFHYWYNGQIVAGTPSYTNNAGGWGKVMSSQSDELSDAYSDYQGVITATFTYHQTNYWDGNPPSSVTVRNYVNLEGVGGTGTTSVDYDTGLFNPDYISDGSTNDVIDVVAYQDIVINNPARSFSVSIEPTMNITCTTGPTGNIGGVSTSLKYIACVM